MLAYGLGRSLEFTDAPAVETLTAEFLADDMKLKGLVNKVVTSNLFATK